MKHTLSLLTALLLAPLALAPCGASGPTSSSSSTTTRAGWSAAPTETAPSRRRTSTAWRRRACCSRTATRSAPSCAPSRAALLTGRNFWELEQGAFIQAWLPTKFATLPDLLEPAGYHAGYTGKGWGPGVNDRRRRRTRSPAGKASTASSIKSPPDGIGPIDYAANFAKFLDARPAGKPFYFWAGLIEPHHPHGKDNHQKLGVGLDAIKLPGFIPDTPGVRRASRQLPLRGAPRRQHARRAAQAARRPRRTRQHPRHRHGRQRHAHPACEGQRL